jgi:hypothetical protein
MKETDDQSKALIPNEVVLPARHTQSAKVVVHDSVGSYLLPELKRLGNEECREVDRSEGLHPSAIDHIAETRGKTPYDIIRFIAMGGVFSIALYVLFPWGHIFKPALVDRPVGPVTDILTEENVKERGGIRFLKPAEIALFNISSLVQQGEQRAVKDACAVYLNALSTREEHKEWRPIWRHYLQSLYLLQEKDALIQQCEFLKSKIPDSLDAEYYIIRSNIEGVPRQDSYRKKDRKQHEKSLNDAIQKTDVALKTISASNNNQFNDLRDGFALLSADAHQRMWWLSKYDWDNPNREKAFDLLRTFPDGSIQALPIRLGLYRECQNQWDTFLWDPTTRQVDGEKRTLENLKQRVRELERVENESHAKQMS